MSADLETEVRERAYHIWETEGRREGWALDHWMRAMREVSAPARPDLASEPAAPESVARAKAVSKAGVVQKSKVAPTAPAKTKVAPKAKS